MIWHLQINESKIGRVEMEIHTKKNTENTPYIYGIEKSSCFKYNLR